MVGARVWHHHRAWVISLLLGGLLGLSCLLSVGGVILGVLSVGLLRWVTRHDREGLYRLAVGALVLRWVVILGVTATLAAMERPSAIGSETSFVLFGDEAWYTVKAWWMRNFILGQPLAPDEFLAVAQDFSDRSYGRSGHLYPMVLFYHLFGYSPTAIKGISALLGVLTGLLIYDMTRHLAGRGAARLACLFVWYWPSLILWSVTNLKDPYIIFLLCLAIWSFQRWVGRQQRVGYLILTVAALYAHATIKENLWALMAAAMGLAWLCHLRRRLLRWGALLCGIALLGGVVATQPQVQGRVHATVQQIVLRHIHNAGIPPDPARDYQLLPTKYYQPLISDGQLEKLGLGLRELVPMAVWGYVYFVLVPLPWRAASLPQLAVVPQMLVWYGLLGTAAAGIWSLRRTWWREALLPLSVMVGLTLILGVSNGNVGTAFRHRDLVTPLYLMFAAIGLSRLWTGRQEPAPAGHA